MTNETLAEKAQRLKDEGRLDEEKGTYKPTAHVSFCKPEKIIRDYASLLKDGHITQSRMLNMIHEAYAALAVLDGSIVLEDPNP